MKTSKTLTAILIMMITSVVITLGAFIFTSTNYIVRDIDTGASMNVRGAFGFKVEDTVWVKHTNVVSINSINNVDPLVRPMIVK